MASTLESALANRDRFVYRKARPSMLLLRHVASCRWHFGRNSSRRRADPLSLDGHQRFRTARQPVSLVTGIRTYRLVGNHHGSPRSGGGHSVGMALAARWLGHALHRPTTRSSDYACMRLRHGRHDGSVASEAASFSVSIKCGKSLRDYTTQQHTIEGTTDLASRRRRRAMHRLRLECRAGRGCQ